MPHAFSYALILPIGVIYAGAAGDMSPPLFEMANFVPTTLHIAVGHRMFFFLFWKKCPHHFSKQSDALDSPWSQKWQHSQAMPIDSTTDAPRDIDSSQWCNVLISVVFLFVLLCLLLFVTSVC